MKRRLDARTFAAVAMLAVVGVLALVTQRNETPAYDSYASTDFASGGVRAWAALLQSEGVRTARFVRRPVELDASTDTLIAVAPLPFLAEASGRIAADVADLANWVRRGGRLVAVGRVMPKAEEEYLRLPRTRDAGRRRAALAGPWLALAGSLAGFGTTRLQPPRGKGVVVEAGDRYGALVVRYPLGRGEVVAVADAVPFTNAFIGRAGNARLAYLLGRPAHAGGMVAFDDGLHGALRDRPWYRALPVPLLVALAFAAAGAALALAGAALPSGPPVTLARPREPTSAEFLAAVAALYERTRARDAARAIVAHEAFAAVARRAGLPDSTPPDEVAGAVRGRAGGADVERLAATLHAPVNRDDDLVAAVRLAHTIRKDFAHGNSGNGRRAAFAGRLRAHRRR